MRRVFALGAAMLLLGGCLVYVKDRTLAINADAEGWRTIEGLHSQADASYRGRLADVLVSARADDPYTPVKVRVRPGDAATVRLLRENGKTGSVGAWRLTDRKANYVGTRVPRAISLGESVAVPAGTDLLVEFDPGSVFPGSSLSSGDAIVIDLRVDVGDDRESVPVRLRVIDTHRGWYFGFAGH